MANTPKEVQATPEKKKKLTWKEKMANGERLNPLEETQADADFNYRRRLREQEELAKYEQSKQNVKKETK